MCVCVCVCVREREREREMAVMLHQLNFHHFSVDVCEAHYAQIAALLLTVFIGEEVWHHHVSWFILPFPPPI